jgi:hypothetical protein
MTHRRVLLLVPCVAALALGGPAACGGDDDDADRERQRAEDYALAVERITDAVYEDGSDAIVALNRARDGSLAPARAGAELDRLAGRVATAEGRLRRLRPPEAARSTARDLRTSVDALALHLRLAATDVRAAARGAGETVRSAAAANARLVLADSSGMSALSRAVRTIADAAPS